MAFPIIYADIVGYVLGGLLLIIMCIGLLTVYLSSRRTIRRASKPIRQLALSADEVAKGNFTNKIPEQNSHDEIHQLRDSFEKMQYSLTRYIEELKETTTQKASIESELKIAQDIQMSMLPKTFPPFPERHDIDIYGQQTPAKAVGGDLFDFFIHDNQLYFCIGDVSGKGIPASMLMAVTRSLFRNIAAHVTEPNDIVKAINNSLVESNETNMFVTLFMGVLNLQTGHLRYCNAGHIAPLLINQGVSTLPCDPNLPLGVISDWQFTIQETTLTSQTTIFLYTDGLNEAENVYHDQLGDQRIIDLAANLALQGQHQPIKLIQAMTEAVHSFVGTAEQSDDLTMLAIQYFNVL
jgi:sigma-B regulation protein RsbU (phosphoserine phosphatase)